VQSLIGYAREHGFRRIEVPAEDEAAWMAMIEKLRPYSSFQERGQYYGGNTPGKAKRFLLNPGGRPKLDQFMAKAADGGYQGFLR
jgi:hypothetical protein